MVNLKRIGLFAGLIAFGLIYFFADFGEGFENAKLMAAIAAWVAIWWITEPVPLAVTSLLPLILFPVLGLLSAKDTSQAYINSTIFLFMGGFIIALAMEKWNLHKRIALYVISLFGSTPSKIILGFMTATGFISMWISNTATAIMVLPIGLAILYKLEDQFGAESIKKFAVALMLGIAYSSSIGGIATLIGTPPNLVLKRIYSISFPDKPEILFGEWVILVFPLAAVLLFLAWIILTKLIFKPGHFEIDKSLIKNERKLLGKMSFEEKAVSIISILTSVFWIFRADLDVGVIVIPGFANLLPFPELIDDSTIAIGMSILLFLIPVKTKGHEDKKILTVKIFRKIPWEIILLFGGGFALAEGFVSSGLSNLIGSMFLGLKGMNIILLIFIVCLTITFLTELTSNTATAQIILPILASIAIQFEIHPLLLMIPATISASMAFMMPVATPPNAIVFGSQRINILNMAKAGLILNLFFAVLITIYFYFHLI
ncbi:MAG: sodium:dicarboxylate symporter [Ignavibacteria bacterium GWB2_35_6b]|nr:MAG: sodium:dicarboxylate symporter [Ignavibacteria bacterium GWB2_35_6b]